MKNTFLVATRLTTKGILPEGWKMVERNGIETHKLQRKPFLFYKSL